MHDTQTMCIVYMDFPISLNTLQTGEKIMLLSRVDEEWVFGELAGHIGMLPVSFVNSNPDSLPPHKKDDKPSQKQCLIALFDFEGDEEAEELSFKSGDVIVPINLVSTEWMKGSIGARTGIFPLNFVEVTNELPKDISKSSFETSKCLVTVIQNYDDVLLSH